MQKNKNRKSKIGILMAIVFCLPVFSVSTYAQSPSSTVNCSTSTICSAPATAFRLTTDFVREMILAIKTVGTRDPYVGKYVSPSWFEGNEFVPPKESLLDKFTKNVKQKLQSLLAISAIATDLPNFGGIKDFAGGLIVLLKSRPYLRDYKTLMDLDSLINDKKYELGLGGGWTETISPANLKIFQGIVDKYGSEGEGLFTSDAKIEDTASYRKVVMLMTRIVSALKTFIASPGLRTAQFKDEFTKSKLFSSADIMTVDFNRELIQAMEDEYRCIRLVKCNDDGVKFVSNIKKIGKTFGSGTTDVRATIKDASKRLGVALGFGTQEDKKKLKERQKELLRTQFGLKTTTATSGWFGAETYRSQRAAAGKKISDGRKDMQKELWQDNQRAALFPKSSVPINVRTGASATTQKEIEAIKGKYLNVPLSNEEQAVDNTIALFLNPSQDVDISVYKNVSVSMNDLFTQTYTDTSTMAIADNTDVTSYFYPVLMVVKDAIDQIIGKRNVANTLIDSLGNACKAQCANVGGKCFY